MKVLKFGGTSVGTVRSLTNVKKIVESIEEPAIVVVSALGGLTDRLLAAADMARHSDKGYRDEIQTMTRRHHEIIDNLVAEENRHEVKARIDTLIMELHRIYDGVAMLGDLPEKTLDQIVSFGERMSSFMISYIISDAKYFHSPDFIKTEKWFNRNIADSKLTETLIRETLGDGDFKVAVTGGFISTDRDSGEITNLGRGGSDYTAATVVDHMTFIESMELCTMGAKVIYPPTIYPVFHKNIPIRILNTFHPEAPGTWITDDTRPEDLPVKGISAVRNTTLIRVDGAGADSHRDEINSRTYNAMAKNGVSLYLVNSRDSEGFTFAVSSAESGTAIKILTDEFGPELSKGELENISATYKLATIAVVGEKMKSRPSLMAELTRILAEGGVKVHAVSDGTSQSWWVPTAAMMPYA